MKQFNGVSNRVAGQVSASGTPNRAINLKLIELATDFNDIFVFGRDICQALEQGKLIIFIGSRFEHVSLLRSYSAIFRIPLIFLDVGIERESNSMELASPYELQFGVPYADSFYAAIKFKQWTSFFAFYDSDEALQRLSDLFKRLSLDGIIIESKLIRISTGEEQEVADRMKLFHRDISNVIIDITNYESLTNFLTNVTTTIDFFCLFIFSFFIR